MMFPSSRTLPGKSYVFKIRCASRSEEHTSELQSQSNLVCRLLLEKKKIGSDSKTSQRMTSLTTKTSGMNQTPNTTPAPPCGIDYRSIVRSSIPCHTPLTAPPKQS